MYQIGPLFTTNDNGLLSKESVVLCLWVQVATSDWLLEC